MCAAKMGFEGGSEARVRLGDVLWELHAAGAKLLEFTAGRGWAEFSGSEPLQAFAAKMLVIAGDCLRELRTSFPEEYARVHGADRLLEVTEQTAPEALWRVVEEVLPGAVAAVHAMLAEWYSGGPAAGQAGERADDSRERVVVVDGRRVEYED